MDVLFPFGHGLSYTTFAYSNLRLSADSIQDTDALTVQVDVTNTGSLAGKEVVQLYVGDVESSVFRPVRELKGFEKIALEPGQTKTVTFTLSKRAFAYWNVQLSDWHVETGLFRIEIGRSSRDIVLSADVTVESTATVPMEVSVNSIFMDLMKNPKAMAVLEPLMRAANAGTSDSDSDVANEAITADMAEAMMRYSPLRSAVSFSDGKLTYDQLQAIVDQINNG